MIERKPKVGEHDMTAAKPPLRPSDFAGQAAAHTPMPGSPEYEQLLHRLAPAMFAALRGLVVASDGHPGSFPQREEARAILARVDGETA